MQFQNELSFFYFSLISALLWKQLSNLKTKYLWTVTFFVLNFSDWSFLSIVILNWIVSMEHYATDFTLSFGFCFYFPLWLFFNFIISCLTLPCPPVCKPQALGNGVIKNYVIRLITGRKSISMTQILFESKENLLVVKKTFAVFFFLRRVMFWTNTGLEANICNGWKVFVWTANLCD